MKHGKYGTSEHKAWENMRNRCNNPNHPRYKDWGGRGITICEEWNHADGFIQFLRDMGEKPTPKHTLERRDNTIGYSKENCFWATTKEQALNRRSTLYIEYAGKVASAYNWAKIYQIKYVTLVSRKRRGWSDSEAIEGERRGLI